jgi:hypothetical protein
MLNNEQTRMVKLVKTYRTLTAAGYPAAKALKEISRGFGLDRTELEQLIKLLAN